MIDRPTFSENWHRVANVKPRLRAAVQTYRQHFRGRTYHVLQDPSANQYFRIDDAGYLFIALLDGRRTVAQVWDICNEQLGDRAPTQGEAIQLLGQLYAHNLLQADLPPDASSMFERQRKRIGREVRGYLMNLLFARFPLWDPDRVLERWVGIGGLAFTWPALVGWCVLMLAGLGALAGRWADLFHGAQGILSLDNLLLLYVCFAGIKLLHEFGHGFACKRFGQRHGSGGEVHTLGIMLLVFTPVPYVDATSAWAFRSKWERAIVGAAGMYVELAVAAVAAMVWAGTVEGSPLHAIAYNLMFIAGVSTILFNANPLLRFDGYYILSDLMEIPNLSQRGKDYLYYLVKKYIYGVRNPQSPARSRDEKPWLVIYAIAAAVYRVFISVAILLFVAGQFFFIGALMAVVAVIGWVVVPLGKFVHYLWVGPELMRTRPRAVAATVGTLAVMLGVLGLIPVPDRARAEGVVEPRHMQVIYAESDGFVESVLPSDTPVQAGHTPLLVARNWQLDAWHRRISGSILETQVRIGQAMQHEMALAQSLLQRLNAYEDQQAQVEERLAKLTLRAPIDGRWISPEGERLAGDFIAQGQPVGLVADVDNLIIRAVADQYLGPRIESEVGAGGRVELRVRGRPDQTFYGTVERIPPAGSLQLPSAALGYQVGGAMLTMMDDPTGRRAAEQFFEIVIRPDLTDPDTVRLLTGQRVAVRFTMNAQRPLLAQWMRAARQLVQKRLRM